VGLVMTYGGGPDDFCETCTTIFQDILKLENKYGLSIQEVRSYVEGRHLEDAIEIIREVKNQTQRQADELKKQLHELASILGKSREELVEVDNIRELKRKIKEFEGELKRNLGEPGLKLLNFLLGREDFPDKLTREELKEALIRLRPFIVVRCGGEDLWSD